MEFGKEVRACCAMNRDAFAERHVALLIADSGKAVEPGTNQDKRLHHEQY